MSHDPATLPTRERIAEWRADIARFGYTMIGSDEVVQLLDAADRAEAAEGQVAELKAIAVALYGNEMPAADGCHHTLLNAVRGLMTNFNEAFARAEAAEALLRDCRAAVTTMPEDALGGHQDEDGTGWFFRDELLHHIDAHLVNATVRPTQSSARTAGAEALLKQAVQLARGGMNPTRWGPWFTAVRDFLAGTPAPPPQPSAPRERIVELESALGILAGEVINRQFAAGEAPKDARWWSQWAVNAVQACKRAAEDTSEKLNTAKCAWPGCTAEAFCATGNFGGLLVCREHFGITNGHNAALSAALVKLGEKVRALKSTEETDRYMERYDAIIATLDAAREVVAAMGEGAK